MDAQQKPKPTFGFLIWGMVMGISFAIIWTKWQLGPSWVHVIPTLCAIGGTLGTIAGAILERLVTRRFKPPTETPDDTP
jgi:hypothetical protein